MSKVFLMALEECRDWIKQSVLVLPMSFCMALAMPMLKSPRQTPYEARYFSQYYKVQILEGMSTSKFMLSQAAVRESVAEPRLFARLSWFRALLAVFCARSPKPEPSLTMISVATFTVLSVTVSPTVPPSVMMLLAGRRVEVPLVSIPVVEGADIVFYSLIN